MRSRSELLKLIEDFVKENNEDIIHEFGNWRDAFKEADVNINNISERVYYTDEDILNALRRFYQDYGERMSDGYYQKVGRKPSTKVIHSRFGSWNKALEAAGIPTRDAIRKFTDEEVTAVLKNAFHELGYPFTTIRYSQWSKLKGEMNVSSILRKHGSWKRALETANIKQPSKK